MNGTTASQSGIESEVIWIPYTLFILLTIVVLVFSFVRYHRRKIEKRRWPKEYADKNLEIKRSRIQGIACNSNDMKLMDLGSSMMHSDILKSYSDVPITSLPNFTQHNLELTSSKDTTEFIDVNKIVIEDWRKRTEIKQPRIPHASDIQNNSSDVSEHDLVEIGIGEICESCKKTVYEYQERKRPDRFLQLSKSEEFKAFAKPCQDSLAYSVNSVAITTVEDDLTGSESYCLSSDQCRTVIDEQINAGTRNISSVGNKRLKEYQNSLLRSKRLPLLFGNYDNVAFTPVPDIYAVPIKKSLRYESDPVKSTKSTSNTDVPENIRDRVNIDQSQRKRPKRKVGIECHQKTYPKRKRSYRKQISRLTESQSSMSECKGLSHHNPPRAHMVATDYSSTTSSERESSEEYRPYEAIWSNESERPFSQNIKNIHDEPYHDQRASTSSTNEHICQNDREILKEGLKMDSYSDNNAKEKMKLAHQTQSNSLSENSVTHEKWLLHETAMIDSYVNSKTIEKVKLREKLKKKPNIIPDIVKEMKLHDNRKDNRRSIAQSYHHQLINSTTLHRPCNQYFNYTDAEKMKTVAPKSIEHRSGDIYWLDIHNEDTMV